MPLKDSVYTLIYNFISHVIWVPIRNGAWGSTPPRDYFLVADSVYTPVLTSTSAAMNDFMENYVAY